MEQQHTPAATVSTQIQSSTKMVCLFGQNGMAFFVILFIEKIKRSPFSFIISKKKAETIQREKQLSPDHKYENLM